MPNRRFSSRPRLAVEGLEARDVPAGTVNATVSGTVLTLAGDDLDNNILIHKDGAGKVVVTGVSSTNITTSATSGAVVGAVFTSTSTGITSVKAKLFGGSDSIANDDFTADFAFTGGFSFEAGDGANNILLLTDGGKRITLGSVTYKGLDGSDHLIVNSIGANGSTIGAVTLIGGDGPDAQCFLTNVLVKSVKVSTVQGYTNLDLTSVTGISASPLVQASGGNSTTVDIKDSVVGAVNATSKGLTQFFLIDTGTAALTSAGKVNVSSGSLGDALFQANGTTTLASISVKAGNNVQYIDSNATTAGAVAIAGSKAVFALLNFKVDSLSVKGGVGNDIVNTSPTFNTTGNVTISTGTGTGHLGNDNVSLSGSMGKVSLTTGAGDDTIFINAAQITGSATINTGAGADILSILAASKFFQSLKIDQGTGDDTLTVDAFGPVVTFSGKVTVKQGTGNDSVNMDLVGATPPVFSVAGNLIDGGLGFDFNAGNVNSGVSSNPNLSFANFEV